MTKRHWIILADYYRRGWGIPDHSHGEVYPGPYTIEGEAEKALDAYIAKEIDPACHEGYRDHFVVVPISLPIKND
jgi:hypothetical protein